jgi:hypothetical protein
MGGARTAVLVVPPTVYLVSNFGSRADLSAAGYHTAFSVCLGLATGALVSTLFVTETRCRNIWRRAAH